MSKFVYLCGAIAGTSYDECRHGWRAEAAKLLLPDILPLSPMRQESVMQGTSEMPSLGDDTDIWTRQRSIYVKDLTDIRRCDAVLCYLKDAKKVSIGSVFEIGFCKCLNKPLVIVLDANDKIYQHCFILEAADFLVDNLVDGVRVVNGLLSSGV